ncbi:hypothetical protein SAMN06265222_11081 [Neorhodopirellula lusitana]|uniref:Alpha/beta hydrolase n=1 Tax=Neorhodopirellula lusitana TaxID=445327 RepID=A0ABY1QG62_9BACT|nr:hypothetical protein [Neorhodopirellula lusitana]SMP67010.1 hypothetical protein SAMN06265222_11081 [Neorhodopirellula lusitana]
MSDPVKSPPVVLVPGFMSPAWTMWPLAKYLQRSNETIVRWDYPRIFTDLDASIVSLSKQLSAFDASSISIVSHSFGDWLTRSALHLVNSQRSVRLISICPVTTAVPLVKLTRPISQYLAPELRIMSRATSAAVSLPVGMEIDRTVVHAKGEILVRQQKADDQRFVLGSHTSVLFQPNVWKLVHDELQR